MKNLDDNKELLILGTKLQMCDEHENASKVYLSYIRAAAKISESEDSLKILYGSQIYSKISKALTCGDAIVWASFAVCAKELILLMKNMFPDKSVWQSPTKENLMNKDVIKFFTWLAKTPKGVEEADYKILRGAYCAFSKPGKICIEVSSTVERYTLMEAVSGIVNGTIRVDGKKLIK